jgi:preprotein translocase subunit SecA
MTKKTTTTSSTAAVKGSGSKADRQKAAAAANPVRPEDVAQAPNPPKAASGNSGSVTAGQPARPMFRRPLSLNFAGVGRNDICPCGSGKRFKNCHGH